MAKHPEFKEAKRVILISDGTGETAAQMTKAAMVQFKRQRVQFTRYKKVRSEAQLDAILDDASIEKDLIVYTIVSPQLRGHLVEAARAKSVPTVDLIGPLLAGLANYFGYEPTLTAGLLHDVNESYFKRIEAMEYTIAHDDGRDLTGLEQADLVILGISRTSKTPISMYFSHHGWKVCNIPIILGFDIPQEVLKIDQRRVVGLTIDSEELARIRRARLQRLGQERGGDYADLDKVSQEVEYVNELFRKHRRWAVFNVTGKALEETASEIIKLMSSRKLIPPHTLENLAPAVLPKSVTSARTASR